jgi:ProP effector
MSAPPSCSQSLHMPAISPSPAPRRQQNEVLTTLTTTFKAFGECQPLAIGIHKVIKERLTGIDPDQLRVALRTHTASTRYLKALSQSKFRFDLDGLPLGEVTEEQRRQAMDMLRDRLKKQADRHKAAELAKQQQEKLRLLAEKFNSR